MCPLMMNRFSEGTSCNEDTHEGESDDGEGDFVLESKNEDESVDGEGERDDKDDEGMHFEQVSLDKDENKDEERDEEETT